MIRRLTGYLTLAAIVAAGAASHHHSILAADSETRSEEVVTTHNPFSTASHWHAILFTGLPSYSAPACAGLARFLSKYRRVSSMSRPICSESSVTEGNFLSSRRRSKKKSRTFSP